MKKLILISTILALSVFLSACSNTAANKAAQKENANQTQKELSTETSK